MKKKEKSETPQKLTKVSLKRETILGLVLSQPEMGQTSKVPSAFTDGTGCT